jgi:hypothetical protein
MPSLTRNIQVNDPLHKKLIGMVGTRIKLGLKAQTDQHEVWKDAENTTLAYVPESDLDRLRKNKRDGGEPKYTTIKLPYTYALLMAAHTYLTSVFFARSPVHQFSGRHGESEGQVQALEALIAYQTQVGEMMAPYYMWLYDSLKYGLGVIEEYWEKEIIQSSSIEMIPDAMGLVGPDGQPMMKKNIITMQSPGYEGMRLNNICPYDFIHDPRVTVGNYQKGEFAGCRKVLSWSTIKRREAQGYYMNVERLKGQVGKDFYAQNASSELERPEDNLTLLEADDLLHPSTVTVYEMCVEIFPKEWGLGPSEYPEKWMFTVTGDLSVLIGVQPHGAAHGKFPYGVLESEVEPYGTYSRGIPEIAEPIQNTMDWLINTHFFNVRAAMNNQFIIDPSKVVIKDAEKGGAGFVWRLRPSAYGQDIRTFVHQIPVQDMTRGHVQDLQTMLGIGERVFGINDQILGALSGSGRKTATEVRTTTGFGVNRLKTITEYMSACGFAAHATRMVQMSQQYFSSEKKFRIVGSLAADMNPNAAEAFMKVNRDSIGGFYDFVPVDGTLPVDRLAMANLWKEILTGMQSMPALLMQYDLGKMFAHVAQLGGIRNLNQFKVELTSPGGAIQEAQAGNLIAVGGRGAPGGRGANNPRGVGTAGPSAMPANMPIPQ